MMNKQSAHDAGAPAPDGPAPTEPLSPLESHLAEAEALTRAPLTGEALGGVRRGRVEAETHRISDEVTRAAQLRRVAEQRRQAQLAVPPQSIPTDAISGADAVGVTPTDATPTRSATVGTSLAWLPASLGFQRILVPLDGSARAERAIPVAARIAQASHGSVLLMRVVSPPGNPGAEYFPVAQMLETALDAATEYLKQIADRPELAGVEVHSKALSGFAAATILLDAIQLYERDLVVLCSHGRSGLIRWALGSVAQRIVREAAAPALILRPDVPLPPSARQLPEGEPTVRALVTLDGSALAESALLPAARLVAALAGPGQGELHLLRVLDYSDAAARTSPLPYRDPDLAALEEARTYLSMVARRFEVGELARLGLRVSWSTRDDVDVAGAILDEAERDAAAGLTTVGAYDLIAMATHGRSGLKLWALGSVTDRVLQTTGLPLLVAPPRAEASRGEAHENPG